MKILDLQNIQKYFYMADTPYYKLQHFTGDICEIIGTALNTLSNEVQEFNIKLNIDNSITFQVGDDILTTLQ
jgi:hypothetical protein